MMRWLLSVLLLAACAPSEEMCRVSAPTSSQCSAEQFARSVCVDPSCPDPCCHSLSALGLFDLSTPGTPRPLPGTHPYEVSAPFFWDNTVKQRFVRLPSGGVLRWHPSEPWSVPDGSILIKNIGVRRDPNRADSPIRWMETRVLVRNAGTFLAATYVWNEANTDARRSFSSQRFALTRASDEPSSYRAPPPSECSDCHGREPLTPIGLTNRQLDRSVQSSAGVSRSQIEMLVEQGILQGVGTSAERVRLTDPADTSAPLEARARSYLDANCAHCHREGGLRPHPYFGIHVTNPQDYGVCSRSVGRQAAAAEHRHRIVPGHPEESQLMCLFELPGTNPARMPPGGSMVDPLGRELLQRWITEMRGSCDGR